MKLKPFLPFLPEKGSNLRYPCLGILVSGAIKPVVTASELFFMSKAPILNV